MAKKSLPPAYSGPSQGSRSCCQFGVQSGRGRSSAEQPEEYVVPIGAKGRGGVGVNSRIPSGIKPWEGPGIRRLLKEGVAGWAGPYPVFAGWPWGPHGARRAPAALFQPPSSPSGGGPPPGNAHPPSPLNTDRRPSPTPATKHRQPGQPHRHASDPTPRPHALLFEGKTRPPQTQAGLNPPWLWVVVPRRPGFSSGRILGWLPAPPGRGPPSPAGGQTGFRESRRAYWTKGRRPSTSRTRAVTGRECFH